jgi:hypothetical protein
MTMRERYEEAYIRGLANRDPHPDVHLMLSRDEVSLVLASLDTLACAPWLGPPSSTREMDEVIRDLRRKISMLAFGHLKGE